MTRNTYIKDDWDDNALTGRTSPETGAFLHPAGSTEAGDCLTGMYRPEWTTESGSPSATSGVLSLSAGDTTEQRISTKTDFTTGSWKVDFITSASSSGSINLWTISDGTVNNILFIALTNAGDYLFRKGDSGTYTTLITSTFTEGNTVTGESTRSPYGDFELFKNGTSVGTATDTFIPEVVEVQFRNTTNSTQEFDNLQVA